MQDFLYEALIEQDTLCHHGILGQKWGVRRYQNADGSLTELGKKRYTKDSLEANNLRTMANGYKRIASNHKPGLGKLILTAKANSLAKKAERAESKVTISEAFKKSGWKVDDSGDFGGDIYAEKSSKLGPDSIKVYTVVDPGDKSGYIDDHIKTLDSKIKKLESNSDTIYKQTSKFIADDLYNDNVDDVKDKMSASEYRKALKATGAYVTDWDTLDIDFSHPEHGSHILSVEYDLNNLKPIIERGVRMNG